MRIWVKGYLGLQAVFGDRPLVEVDTDGCTIRELLHQLEQAGDESLAVRGTGGRLAILVNGRHASHLPDGLDTVLKEGDQVAIFPPVAGG